MNCPHWQDLFQQHLDGDSPPGTLDRHLRDCPDCRGNQAAVRRLLAGLALLRPAEPPADLAGRLTARLCAEARASRIRVRRRRIGALAGLAAAAAVLLSLGLWSWRPGSRTGPGNEVVVAPTHREKPAPPLREPVAQAGQAVAALGSRTAGETVQRTTSLLPLVSGPALDPLTKGQKPVEPKLESLREAADGVSAGLAPVANSARRAVNLFFRDLPMTRDERPARQKKPT
jgi:hypothetical protein